MASLSASEAVSGCSTTDLHTPSAYDRRWADPEERDGEIDHFCGVGERPPGKYRPLAANGFTITLMVATVLPAEAIPEEFQESCKFEVAIRRSWERFPSSNFQTRSLNRALATVPTADDNPNEGQPATSALPPTRLGKTTRQVKIDKAATVLTVVLTMAEHGSGIHKRSSERSLTGVELVQEVRK